MPFVTQYIRLVDWIADTTGFPDALLHVHAGLAIMLLSALVLRRSLASPVPLAIVCAAEGFNEVMDRLAHGRWMPDTASDIVNTIFWPALIFAVVRWFPRGRVGRARKRKG